MRQLGRAVAALGVLTLLVGCASEAANTAVQVQEPMGDGSFTTKFDGKEYTVDYTGFSAKVEMKHRVAASGPACVGYVDMTLAGENEVCKLEMTFEPDFGGGLVLKRAEFHAKVALYQDSYVIDAYQCPMFADMMKFKPGFKPAVFSMQSGDVMLALKPLMQPQAGMATTPLAGYELNPKGSVKMKMGGKVFTMDLTGLKVKGDITSKGSKTVSCSQTYLPPSDIILKDINPKSPTSGQEVDLSTDFEGKFVTVHMGAGW